MPHKCCVATCKGNYQNGPKRTVFCFPKEDDILKKWIWSCKRQDSFVPTKHSRVCEVHFREDDIIRQSEFFDEKSGKKIVVPLSHPRLKPGAIPTLFPDGPSHLNSPVLSRESPNCKKRKREIDAIEKALVSSLHEKELYNKRKIFNNLMELKACLDAEILPDDWIIVCKSEQIMLLNIIADVCPKIMKSVVIDSDLNVYASIKNVLLKTLDEMVLPSKINDINVLLNVLKKVDSFTSVTSAQHNVQDYIQVLSELMTDLKEFIPDKKHEIIFFLDQISKYNTPKQKYSYSSDVLIFSCLLHSISPHAYNFIRSSQNLIMPHPRTIQKIFSDFNLNPINEQSSQNFLSYIKFKFQELTEKDTIVILMVDEIHLNQGFDYKGGNICGMSCNSTSAASSAFVFMIRSLLSVYKDVVHIFPVKTLAAENLYDYIRKIIIELESIGFKIIAVVSDNNSINRKAMSQFSTPPKISILYKNPFDSFRPLFFLIDSVHIIKCIRNNWVNQKNDNQCMFYPNFNTSQIETAAFSCLKKLHELESGKILKYSYGLTLKALYPTNLEKQNVKLSLQVFNCNVAEALVLLGQEKQIENFEKTGEFIKIINTWWSIVNVKSIFKGIHKNNVYETPLTVTESDEKYIFLNKLIDWLDNWQNLNLASGCLTKETHFTLRHTTYALLEMTRYCINELGFNYLLAGKVQTDTLESRFGKYRQLAGAQHNISIRQVYETEAKLRLQATLPNLIKSSKYGNIPIHISDFKNHEESSDEIEMDFDITVDDSDIDDIKLDLPILAYVAGYCCYSVVKRLKCDFCKSSITTDKELISENDENVYSWIKVFDRGLKYPHPDVLNAIVYNFIVVKKLISDKYETKFLFAASPRNTVCKVTLNLLSENLFFLDLNDCPKSHDPQVVLKNIIRSSTNIFLNNYCKKLNDNLSKNNLTKQRKLKTLK